MFKKFLLLILVTFSLCNQSIAQPLDWYNGRWSHEISNIKPDPNVTFGRLNNGFRYAIIPNKRPEGKASIFLVVQAGSLMENDQELGLAHYLEHMAFNGSKNFPAGSIVDFFQEHGMDFGGDANAHTNKSETVYKIHLANNKPATINDSLNILRDFSDGLLLDKTEIDKERGVIFSEKRARETEKTLLNDQWYNFLYKGTRFKNKTIGTDHTLTNANQELIKGFYNKWYVPNRMVLVIVGDVTPDEITPMIINNFSSLKNKGNFAQMPKLGEIDTTETKVLVQKSPNDKIFMQVVIPLPHLRLEDNIENQKYIEARKIIMSAISKRLSDRSILDPILWISAGAYNTLQNPYTEAVSFYIETTADQWQKAIAMLREEIEIVKLYGVNESEVKGYIGPKKNRLKQYINQSKNYTNKNIIKAFIKDLGNNKVYTSNQQKLALFTKTSEFLTHSLLNQQAQKILKLDNARILVRGNIDVSPKEIKSYWKSLDAQVIKNKETGIKIKYPYLKIPPRPKTLPKMTEKVFHLKDFDLKSYFYTLDNDTNVILVPLKFDKDKVYVSYLFGYGEDNVPDNQLVEYKLLFNLLKENGLGKFNKIEFNRQFSSSFIKVKEHYSNNSNIILGSSLGSKAPLLLSTIWTQLMDPTITDMSYKALVRNFKLYKHKRNTASYIMSHSKFFYGENERNKKIMLEDIEHLSVAKMQQKIKQIHQQGQRTLIVVGDFDIDKVRKESVRYFSHVPLNNPTKEQDIKDYQQDYIFPAGKSLHLEAPEDKVRKAYYKAAWRADNEALTEEDFKVEVSRELLANILKNKLFKVIREDKGLAYSPTAYYSFNTFYKGFGMIIAYIQSKPENLPQIKIALNKVVKDILNNGISQEELDRAAKPMLTRLSKQRKVTKNWYLKILNSIIYNKNITEQFDIKPDVIKTITPDFVWQQAKEIFTTPKAQLEVVAPGKEAHTEENE